MKAFTLLETLIATSIISVVSVASVYFIFLSLNLRDLTLATTKVEEAVRIFNRNLKLSVLGASTISGGGNSLYITSPTECWSFVYDVVIENIRYTKTNQADCSPVLNPTGLYFPPTLKVRSMNFLISALATGGRQVNVTGVFEVILPFDTYQTTFSGSYTNLIDQ